MNPQFSGVGKSPLAKLTLERFFPGVGLCVGGQVPGGGEPRSAQVALVRLDSLVHNTHVFLQAAGGSKPHLADLTEVRLLTWKQN